MVAGAAACRIRSRALCRSDERLQVTVLGCVRGFPLRARLGSSIPSPYPVLCPVPVRENVFPLANPLPSTHSAGHGAPQPLFASFTGTMELSDFPPPCSTGVLTKDSRQGPQRHPPWPVGGTSRFPTRGLHTCTGSRTTRDQSASRDNETDRVAFRYHNSVGDPNWFLSRLNTRPMCTPVNASLSPLRMTTHDSGNNAGR